MFKVLTISVLLYIMYKLVFPNKGVKGPNRDNLSDSTDNHTIDVEYEEVE